MKIFELHFNPKAKDDYFFDSFVFEPANQYEKRLGFLYEIGDLKNALPQNAKFLDNLAKTIKDKYFTLSLKTPEIALTESLKEANEFLSQEIKKENVSWLGNLNFAVLSLSPFRNRISNEVKGFDFTFTKTGDIKILMARAGVITDIGKSFEIEKIEPYPLKIFFNIVSGKLMAQDTVLAITKDLYDYFVQQKLIEKLAKAGTLDENKIKDIFPEKIKTAGVCFILYLEKKPAFSGIESKKSKNIFLTRKKEFLSIFPLLKIFSFAEKPLLKLKILTKSPIKALKKEQKEKIKVQPFNLETKKKIYLITLLLILLFVGFLIFKRERNKIDVSQDSSLKIEENLEHADNIVKIEEPNLFYELRIQDPNFKAEKILFSENNFFFYSNNSKDIYNLGLDKEKLDLIKADRDFNLVVLDSGTLFLWSYPNILSIFKNGIWQEKNIQFNFSPDISNMLSYYSNLYFLDKKYCRIVKVAVSNTNVSSDWLKEKPKQECSGLKSIAVDGSLWFLNNDNSIDVYRKGLYQKTIEVNIFPLAENITKIETKVNLPYLYLLEPSKKRIIVLDKEGKIIKQFFSQKFDNLLDFAISEDGKTIYLLNGNKVFTLEI